MTGSRRPRSVRTVGTTTLLALLLLPACTDAPAVPPERGNAATSTAAPSPSASRLSFSLVEVRVGCRKDDQTAIEGSVRGPSGLRNYDGLDVVLLAGDMRLGSTRLTGPQFAVTAEGPDPLPAQPGVALVRRSNGEVLARSAANMIPRPERVCG